MYADDEVDDDDDDDALDMLEAPELFFGTGRFSRGETRRAEVDRGVGGYTLNFVRADIREVIDAVLGEALGETYTIAAEVEGEVTARTARPLTREQVLPALEDILAMNETAMVLSDGIYRIVPLDSTDTAPPVMPGRGRSTFGLHVIPLRHVAAESLSETLESFIAPGRALEIDADRNLLLFRGPGREAQDLASMVEVFDVDWLAGMSFALLPLSRATADDVVTELEAVFGLDREEGPLQGIVRFLPVERMNAVLAISAQPEYLEQARQWTQRLDRGISEDKRQLFVYHVENARAQDLAEVLAQLFDVRTIGERDRRGRTAGAAGEVAPGREEARVTTDGEGASGDSGSGSGTSTAGGGAGTGSAGSGAAGAQASGGFDSDQPRIIADTRNNALLVLATGSEYRMIESTLRQLDLVPLQVLIEATIAEVSLTDNLRFGLRWFFEGTAGDTAHSFTFSDVSEGAVGSSFPGFSYLLEGNNARLVLDALNDITNVNVVSSPQLMVLDNQTARLQVGDQVPVATRSAVSIVEPDAPIVNQIEFQDTGVILEVTPSVNANGLVVLDVEQEVSDVTVTVTSDIDSPTIQQRSISSSVAVQTGETIALGGLIRDSREDSVSGVPLLMDIPYFGNFFRTTSQNDERTELLVLLTPRVVRDQEESRAVTRELRMRMRGLERLRQDVGAHAPELAPPHGD